MPPDVIVNETPADVDAARAAAAAQTASEAAAAAIVQADVTAANAQTQASERISSFEGELAKCRNDISTQMESLQTERTQSDQFRTHTSTALSAITEQLSQIQKRLEPPPAPPPENPNPDQLEGAPRVTAPPEEPPPPKEPEPPRRKAHRWI